jgi:hypothetical protein
LSNLSAIFEPLSSRITRFRLYIHDASSTIAERFLGAMALSGIVAITTVYAWQSFSGVTQTLAPLARGVAYLADYHKASAYPGVEGNKSLRIHENGVVSYAEDDRGTIIITVGFVKLPEAEQPASQ